MIDAVGRSCQRAGKDRRNRHGGHSVFASVLPMLERLHHVALVLVSADKIPQFRAGKSKGRRRSTVKETYTYKSKRPERTNSAPSPHLLSRLPEIAVRPSSASSSTVAVSLWPDSVLVRAPGVKMENRQRSFPLETRAERAERPRQLRISLDARNVFVHTR